MDLLGTGRFDFHLARFSCQLQQRVAPMFDWKLLDFAVSTAGSEYISIKDVAHALEIRNVLAECGVGRILLVEQLLLLVKQFHLLVVDQLSNPILFSRHVSKISLEEADVTQKLSRT